MATLKHNGTELARFKQEMSPQIGGVIIRELSIGSSGWILLGRKGKWDEDAQRRNWNTGWKRWKKIKYGVSIEKVIDHFCADEKWQRIR